MAKWHKSCYSVRSDSFLGLPMSIRIDDVVGVHAHALQVRMQRSEILAANLANVDTPGFQARDIDFASAMSRLESAQDAGAMQAESLLKYRVPYQASLDGNTVELSVEQAEFSRNSMDFQTSLTFLTQKFSGLKQAIEGR